MRRVMLCSLAMAAWTAVGSAATRADDGPPAPTGGAPAAESRSFFLGPVRIGWQFSAAPEAAAPVGAAAAFDEDVLFSLVASAEVEDETGYWIGLICEPATAVLRAQFGLADGQGLVLEDVVPDSPAEQAGLKQYDVVTHAAGRPTTTVDALAAQIRSSAGKALELTILRGGKSQTVSVVPIERSHAVVVQVGRDAPEALRNIVLARWDHHRHHGHHHHGRPGSSSKPSEDKDSPKGDGAASEGCPHCKARASAAHHGGESAKGCPHGCGHRGFGPWGFLFSRHLHGACAHGGHGSHGGHAAHAGHHGCTHCAARTSCARCGHGPGAFWFRAFAHRVHHARSHHGCSACGTCSQGAHHGHGGCPHCAASSSCKASSGCPHCKASTGCPHCKASSGCPHCKASSGCPHCATSSGCPHCGHGPGAFWSKILAHRAPHGCPHSAARPETKSTCPHCEKKPAATESAPAKPAAPQAEAKPGSSAAAGPHPSLHDLLKHRFGPPPHFGPPGHWGPPGPRPGQPETKPQSAARPQVEARPSVERPRIEVRIAEPAEAKPIAAELARRLEAAATRHEAAASAAAVANPAAATKGYDLGQRLDQVEQRLDKLQNTVERLTAVLEKIASQK